MDFDQTIKTISLLSIPISLWALWVAYHVKKTAKQSFELNQQIYSDRQSHFSLYLEKASYKITQNGRIMLFEIAINNKSDSKSSFTATLEFHYKLANHKTQKVFIPHAPGLVKDDPASALDIFDQNPRVDERQTLTKWFCFEEPKNLPEDYQNNKYTIILTDSHGATSRVDAYIANEI